MSDLTSSTRSSAPSLVEVRDLWKVFTKGGQSIEVLKGANLDIHKGDKISIVGQSGSGKSTFLHVLGTLDTPTKGKVFIDGQDVFGLSGGRIDRVRNHQIGFVFQFHHLLPDHDALRNVMMPMIIAGEGLQSAERRAKELLEQVGLQDRLGHRPGELSGGEQQRVAIARALIYKPALLLADEPTGNLDPQTADEIMQLMSSLHIDNGGALIVVTHDHQLADRFSRRLVLQGGVFQERELC